MKIKWTFDFFHFSKQEANSVLLEVNSRYYPDNWNTYLAKIIQRRYLHAKWVDNYKQRKKFSFIKIH